MLVLFSVVDLRVEFRFRNSIVLSIEGPASFSFFPCVGLCQNGLFNKIRVRANAVVLTSLDIILMHELVNALISNVPLHGEFLFVCLQ